MITGSRAADSDGLNSKTNKLMFYIYLLGGVLSLVSSNTRADYNIAIYAFLYIVTKHYPTLKKDGANLLLFSIVIDLLWVYFIEWKIIESDAHARLAPRQSSVNSWTVWTVLANCGLKVFVGIQLQICA